MSGKALGWAKEQRTGGAGTKAVLLCLADYADETHSCWPGQELLATQTEQSVRTVRRQLAALEELGLIRRERRHQAHGFRSSDRYTLNLPANMADRAPTYRPSVSVRSTSNGQPTGQKDATYRTHLADDSSKNSLEEKSGGAVAPPAPTRGSRLPDSFVIDAAMKEWAAREVPGMDVEWHTKDFVDYWRAESGARAAKRDWVAAWRRWMRTDYGRGNYRRLDLSEQFVEPFVPPDVVGTDAYPRWLEAMRERWAAGHRWRAREWVGYRSEGEVVG